MNLWAWNGEDKMAGRITDNAEYMEDVKRVAGLDLPWEKLRDSTVLMSGVTGLIGSFLTDVLSERGDNIRVAGLCRNTEAARERFNGSPVLIAQNVNEVFSDEVEGIDADYVLHLASNTHPVQYSTEPISTITTNIIGTQHMLDYAARHHAKRFVFASSVEIYGEAQKGMLSFSEKDLGYIDCNTLRAGYPESKRAGEALCQAYRAQEGLDIVIPRLSRTYGPTMRGADSKAIAQFIKKGVKREDIVLKSAGTQLYSYSYVADAVSALLTVMLTGKDGEAYNIADPASDITLKELAECVAAEFGGKVIFELPDEKEKAGYSTATRAVLDAGKLRELGWKACTDMRDGMARTVRILRSLEENE